MKPIAWYITNFQPKNYVAGTVEKAVEEANKATGKDVLIRSHPMPASWAASPHYNLESVTREGHHSLFLASGYQDMLEWWRVYEQHVQWGPPYEHWNKLDKEYIAQRMNESTAPVRAK